MKKLLKITGITAGVFFLLLLVLPFVFKDKILDIVKNEANKMLNAKLDFEELNLSFFSHFPKASIELNGLKIIGIGDFSQDTLVSADKIAIAVDISSLFGNRGLDISYVGLIKPVIQANKSENGKVNWDIVKSTTEEKQKETTDPDTSEPSTFNIQLQKLEIVNGYITYVDDSTGMAFHTPKLNVKLQGDMSADQSQLNCQLKAEETYFSMNNAAYLNRAEIEIDMKLNADFKNNRYTFDQNSIRLNAIELKLDGWIALLENAIDIDVRIDTPKIKFKDILSLIPAIYQNNFESLRTSGNLSLNAYAQGKMSGENLPSFRVDLNVDNAKFYYENMPKAIEQISIVAAVSHPGGKVDNMTIDLDQLSFNMAGNPFKATFHATNPISDMNFKTTADGKIDLNAIKEIYPLPDSTHLNGIVSVHLALNGRMSDIEKEKYENIDGNGNLTIDNMTVITQRFPKIDIDNAAASIHPQTVNLDVLHLRIGESDLQAQGNLTNYLPYILRGEKLSGNLELTSQTINVNELSSSPDNNNETTSDATAPDTTILQAIRIPENLNLRLDADIKRILFQKMDLRNLIGNLSVDNGIVHLKPIKADAFGGKIEAKGSYIAPVSTSANPQTALTMSIRQASFEETFKQLDIVQQIVPIFSKTGGNYTIDLDLKAPLDDTMQPILEAFYAKGTLQSNDIHLQNVELFGQLATLLKNDKLRNIQAKDIKIPFLIENGLIKTSPFHLKMGNIDINLSGTTSLSQQINYIAQINMPEGNQVGNLISKANVQISGTFTKPEFKLDTKSLVQDALKQAIGDKLSGTKAGEILSGNTEEQIAKIKAQAEEAGKKLVETARKEGNKLIEKAKNPLAKIAAEKASEKLVKEAQKKADELNRTADEQIQELQKK